MSPLTNKRTLIITSTWILVITFIFFLNSPIQTNPFTTTLNLFNFSSRNESSTSSTTSSSGGGYCDLYDGNWVWDDMDPVYAPWSCPFVGGSFNCYRNGRHDLSYLRYRWKPFACDIPRFDGKKMMEMLRGKRMVFIGDSLNRNMWESLLCSLLAFNVTGTRYSKQDTVIYHIKEYESSIIIVTAPFLVQQWKQPLGPTVDTDTPVEKLRIDVIHDAISNYYDADFLIFNTGHWWNHNKVQNGENFFQEGEVLHKQMDVDKALNIALNTWAKWVDNNVNKNITQVFFVGYTATHFIGGDWNSGGNCDNETEPVQDETLLKEYPSMMKSLENVISTMNTPVNYLNITKLTDYRKDAHPSKYRLPGWKSHPGIPQDCSHWCLPGVPDSWNQLLFASLLLSSN